LPGNQEALSRSRCQNRRAGDLGFANGRALTIRGRRLMFRRFLKVYPGDFADAHRGKLFWRQQSGGTVARSFPRARGTTAGFYNHFRQK